MTYLIRWNDWLYCHLLRFWIWHSRYELTIGNTVGMGPHYRAKLCQDIADMEAQLDRRMIR